MALPTTNITTTLVRNELGAATNNVGQLCTHPNINMWSKKKPVVDDRLLIPIADVGKGRFGNYGIIIPSHWIKDEPQEWIYEKPYGTANSPYRLGDFRGYEKQALPPIRIQNRDGQTFNLVASDNLFFNPFVSNQNDLSVSVYDIPEISSRYLGVEIENSIGQTVWGSINYNDQFNIDFNSMPFSSASWRRGNLVFRFFITDVLKTFDSQNQNDVRVPIHYLPSNPTVQTLSIVSLATTSVEVISFANPFNQSGIVDANYVSIHDITELNPFRTLGSLAIKLKISGNAVISGSDFSVTINPTYFNVSYSFNLFSSLYTTSGSPITSLSLTPSGTEVVLWGQLLNVNSQGNTSEPPNTTKNISIDFRQKGAYMGGISRYFSSI